MKQIQASKWKQVSIGVWNELLDAISHASIAHKNSLTSVDCVFMNRLTFLEEAGMAALKPAVGTIFWEVNFNGDF